MLSNKENKTRFLSTFRVRPSSMHFLITSSFCRTLPWKWLQLPQRLGSCERQDGSQPGSGSASGGRVFQACAEPWGSPLLLGNDDRFPVLDLLMCQEPCWNYSEPCVQSSSHCRGGLWALAGVLRRILPQAQSCFLTSVLSLQGSLTSCLLAAYHLRFSLCFVKHRC